MILICGMLIHRTYTHTAVSAALNERPAVALLGARQVGKTTLARQIAAERGGLYLDLEDTTDRQKLDDAKGFLSRNTGRLVVIDEIHRAPGLFPQLRGLIDERRRAGEQAGHFLLLGSASFDLLRQASETLAGRIAYLDMLPIQPDEAASAGLGIDDTWLRGGFPGSLLAASDKASDTWRADFIRSYLERDLPMFAPRMPSETIGRLWQMLATAQSSPLNLARLSQNLGVTPVMAGRYVDLLADLLMVRRLQPWSGNLAKRLIKAPKVYLRDTGLMHALLQIGTLDQLLGHISMGPSWEGYVIECLIGAAGTRAIPMYYRSADGAEIDLLFEQAGEVCLAIEIKRTSSPTIPPGFTIASRDVNAKRRILVHGGTERWIARGEVEMMGVLDAIAEVRKATAGPFA
jgi:predicted AAA+ superfamily ATPase